MKILMVPLVGTFEFILKILKEDMSKVKLGRGSCLYSHTDVILYMWIFLGIQTALLRMFVVLMWFLCRSYNICYPRIDFTYI